MDEILRAFEYGVRYQQEAVERTIEIRKYITPFLIEIIEDVRDFPEEYAEDHEGAEDLLGRCHIGGNPDGASADQRR